MHSPPDKTFAFNYGSHPTRDLAMRWKARLEFPAGSTAESLLRLEVEDGNGKPVAAGVFEFAGQRLQVEGGEATLTFGDFVNGRHSTALWLHRAGMPPIPGGLTFE